ncbi:hypothetical protein CRUP_022772 [Coryphaenoides rupestris]|nr:hypothetical protein CRUP_022772 [Coryphaenoides rupestris]
MSNKGKKEKKHKRKKDKKVKVKEETFGPVQISKYLKERKKGKYSMISGKKIKIKRRRISGKLQPLWARSPPVATPLSTSLDTVLRSLSLAPASMEAEVRPAVLPKGLILMRERKLTSDMLMECLLFHWRVRRRDSSSSRTRSTSSRSTARNSPSTSCTSGWLAASVSRSLQKKGEHDLLAVTH